MIILGTGYDCCYALKNVDSWLETWNKQQLPVLKFEELDWESKILHVD